ncbi:MAG: response regulator transcription factor [Cyclobacteriaceae bacterium]
MSKLKILVVEDNRLIAQDISEQLEEAGFEVCGQASCYDDAMQLYLDRLPDLLLLDIGLEGEKDGIDLARSIGSFSQVPIMYLTGNEDQETLDRAKKTLPVGFVLKPFRAKEFLFNVDLALSNFVKSQRLHNPVVADAIFLPARDKGHVKVALADIVYIRGDGAYSRVHTTDKQVFDMATNLSTLLRQLSIGCFARISRNHAVNIQHISKLDQAHIWVTDHKLSIGAQYRKELKHSLKFVRTKL